MRRWACALALLIGCDDDEVVGSGAIDRTLLDASLSRSRPVDGGEYVAPPVDAATPEPPCATIDVCRDTMPGLLYNVCIQGAAGGVAQPACLVDPNGVLYLAPLTSGQLVMNLGWTQSTNATLSAANQLRCDEARAELLVTDASMPPKCAGGS